MTDPLRKPTDPASGLNAPRLVSGADGSEIERFLARGDHLYRQQREKLAAEAAAYQKERFELVSGYEARALALANEAKDALREFDRKHEQKKAEGERVLAALSQLREG